jgi:hypothetical protein
MKVVNPDGVSAFTVTCSNLTGTVTKAFRLFDQSGIVTAIDGATTKSDATSATVSFTSISATTIGSPIVMSGFNYQVETSNSQFANKFDILRGSIDGRSVTHPNVIQKARRNTQFDTKLLTISERIVVDDQTAVDVDVDGTEKVTLTFFVEGFLK